MRRKNNIVVGGDYQQSEQAAHQPSPLPDNAAMRWAVETPAMPAFKNVSLDIPAYYNVKLRKHWLVAMFVLGMFTQFALAIYTPAVWRWLYELLSRLLPVIS